MYCFVLFHTLPFRRLTAKCIFKRYFDSPAIANHSCKRLVAPSFYLSFFYFSDFFNSITRSDSKAMFLCKSWNMLGSIQTGRCLSWGRYYAQDFWKHRLDRWTVKFVRKDLSHILLTMSLLLLDPRGVGCYFHTKKVLIPQRGRGGHNRKWRSGDLFVFFTLRLHIISNSNNMEGVSFGILCWIMAKNYPALTRVLLHPIRTFLLITSTCVFFFSIF